jgi:hypothetical protein
MKWIRHALLIGLVAGMAGAVTPRPSPAQEITQAHLAAALDAVTSAKTARGFDNVLPLLSEQTQNRLLRLRPDLHKEIADVVQAQAIALVPRRADLNNSVARIWAKSFTEEELKAIAAFYKSPAGTKLADIGPTVIAQSLQAVRGWSDRVAEELMQKSQAELKKRGYDF